MVWELSFDLHVLSKQIKKVFLGDMKWGEAGQEGVC